MHSTNVFPLPLDSAAERRRLVQQEDVESRDQVLRGFFEESSLMQAVVELEADDFRYVQVNKASARHVGLTPAEVEGRLASEIGIPRSVIEAWLPIIRAALKEGRPRRTEFGVTGRCMSTIIIPVPAGPSDRQRFGFLTEDITEQRRMANRFELSERRALVGQIAAGAAHEIKNPLGFVKANVRFALEELAKGEGEPVDRAELLLALREAMDGLRSITELSNDMLALSRTEPGESRPVDVRGVLERGLALAKVDIRRCARLDTQLEDVPLVRANEGRLQQVILNLVLNAVEAMRSVEREEHLLTVRTATQGESVIVEIRDTGCGIPPDQLQRVFEPFFTTKGTTGTGLGLPLAAKAIADMGGTLSVESRPGAWTLFRISLPAVGEEV